MLGLRNLAVRTGAPHRTAVKNHHHVVVLGVVTPEDVLRALDHDLDGLVVLSPVYRGEPREAYPAAKVVDAEERELGIVEIEGRIG